jgi:hypothetical protein
VYFTLLVYGWWMGVEPGFWAEVTRLRWKALAWAVALLAIVFSLRGALGDTPALRQVLRIIADFYMWSAVIAIMGWAHHKLNRPWPWLTWATESVYPWYMLHQTLIIVLIAWLAPLRLGPVIEPVVLVVGTVLGCWGITSIVRRNRWLRPLFGLRRRAPSRYPLPASPAHRSAHSA